MHHSDAEKLWQEGGKLSTLLPDYRYRPGQQQFAAHFQQQMANGGHIVIEAPAGIGKTYAYLIPILSQSRRAVVATASKLLQDQLYYKDLPLLMEAFWPAKRVVLLKGRNNYLCPLHAENNLKNTHALGKERQSIIQILLTRWRSSETGELTRLLPADRLKEIHSLVVSNSEDCQNEQCRYFQSCPFLLQRQKAKNADLVISNQHVLIGELQRRRDALKSNDLLNHEDILVVDEAHRLYDYAEQELSESWSSFSCRQLLDEIETLFLKTLADHSGFRQAFVHARGLLEKIMQPSHAISGSAVFSKEQENRLLGKLRLIAKQLGRLQYAADLQKDRVQGLPEFLHRFARINSALNHWLLVRLGGRVGSNTGNTFGAQKLAILTRRGRHIRLKLAPTRVDQQIKKFLEPQYCVLMTSATLTEQHGLSSLECSFVADGAVHHRLASPFNHHKQSLMLKLPLTVLPDDKAYYDDLLKHLLPLICLPGKKFLFLVTSYRALDKLDSMIRQKSCCELFLPHKGDKMQILKGFQSAASGVLLATASFWEGLDLADCGICGIIVDRLPFEAPNQPLMQAKEQCYRDQQLNFFTHYQLPRASQRLRQACGRLIRKESDRGVFVVADPRLYSKWYGGVFLESLPSMRIERDIDKVKEFLEKA